MISERQEDIIIERLIERINKANEFFLTNIGKSIKKIRELTPTDAQKLIQILKYGGKYDEIVDKISKETELNVKDIDKIFASYAKKDQLFYKKFYEYRNIPFVEYAENEVLRKHTEALARIVQNEMLDYTRKNVLGYSIHDNKGNLIFKGLKEVYNDALEQALLNVGQGKDTFDSAMVRIINDIGQSGLKTVNYANDRNVRLDSTIRMHLKSRLQELHNENQIMFGDEFDADGVEISVHENPAPDHQDVQGRQFKMPQYKKLQKGQTAKDVNGNEHNLHYEENNTYRPISELNCYHTIFSIIVGVSEPEYSDKELKEIIDRNNKGFDYEGKHYTMYEGTQLQRQLERKIREQKDIQILAKASDNKAELAKAQSKITILNHKYKELSNVSNLPTRANRLRVSGYKRVKIR